MSAIFSRFQPFFFCSLFWQSFPNLTLHFTVSCLAVIHLSASHFVFRERSNTNQQSYAIEETRANDTKMSLMFLLSPTCFHLFCFFFHYFAVDSNFTNGAAVYWVVLTVSLS